MDMPINKYMQIAQHDAIADRRQQNVAIYNLTLSSQISQSQDLKAKLQFDKLRWLFSDVRGSGANTLGCMWRPTGRFRFGGVDTSALSLGF